MARALWNRYTTPFLPKIKRMTDSAVVLNLHDQQEYCKPLVPQPFHVLKALPMLARYIASFGSMFFTTKISSAREKGAFEMDAEFYIKDLLEAVGLKGSKTTGVESKFMKKPIYQSPRVLDKSFASNIVQVLVETISAQANRRPADVIDAVNAQIENTLTSFRSFVPLSTADLSDQYYMDMLLYLYYLEAGKLIPDSEGRVQLRNRIGEGILRLVYRIYQLPRPPKAPQQSDEKALNEIFSSRLEDVSRGISDILKAFKDSGMIKDFVFDVEDLADLEYARTSFNEVTSYQYRSSSLLKLVFERVSR